MAAVALIERITPAAISSKNLASMIQKYADRFAQPSDVRSYETEEYGRDSYSSFIWELQKPVLHRLVVQQQRRMGRGARLLDFACGTGRVLSFLEETVAESEGVDISSAMAEVAKSRCKKSAISVGDICEDHQLAAKKYDIITSFRFLLNVEPDVREMALRQLRSRLETGTGILLVNMHGSSRSLRHPAILFRRRQKLAKKAHEDLMLAEMHPDEVNALFRSCGFEIVSLHGFGLLPQFLYRTPLVSLANWIDRIASRLKSTRYFSIDLLYELRGS